MGKRERLIVDDIEMLLCPCGGNNLHFYEVVVSVAPDDDCFVQDYVFNHIERDAGECREVRPSFMPRRTDKRGGGVSITYICEHCRRLTTETVAFHEGSVYSDVQTDAVPYASLVKSRKVRGS